MKIYYADAYGDETSIDVDGFITFEKGKALFMDFDGRQYAVPIESIIEIITRYYIGK